MRGEVQPPSRLTLILAAAVLAAAAEPAPARAASPQLETGPSAPSATAAARSRVPVGGHPANVVPFTPPRGLRRAARRDGLPAWFADGGFCSTGCRPAARSGWPLRPFRRQHALRAGINELRAGSMHSGIDVQA